MAYIKVNHSKLEKTATSVEHYVDSLKSNMRSAQGDVSTLASSWQGTDYTQFKAEFDKIDNNDSTHYQMVKSMESYAKYLRFAAGKYKEAQANAVNRANSLPRW